MIRSQDIWTSHSKFYKVTVNIFSLIYNEILWRPLFNGLIWFYTALPFHDLGIAIIFLTLTIRIILSPLLLRARRAQKELALIQPEVKKIQEQFKNNREGQGKATMELYAAHKVNPFSGCLIMVVQLPILLALFQVFREGLDPAMLSYLYSFVSRPAEVSAIAFGLLNLAAVNMYLGGAAAIIQFFQMRLVAVPSIPTKGMPDIGKIMQWQLPIIVFIASFQLPSSLALYWTVSNLFDILQEIIIRRVARRKRESLGGTQ